MAEETKEFKDLIKQRGSIKGRLTNFKTYFSLLSSSDINKIHESQVRELGLRVAKLEALFSDFEKCQNQIELLCPVLDDQIRERDQIEEKRALNKVCPLLDEEREEESSAAASSASAGPPQDVYAIDEPSAREACGARGAGCARAADAPCPHTHDSDT
ncbi:hypothetical protein ACJJTC_009287 [Scirpophaga incertulas]